MPGPFCFALSVCPGETVVTSPQAFDADVRAFRLQLRARGLLAALAFLNERTRHRYTGAYRFAPPMLRSIAVVDRENPGVVTAMERPLRDTYCAYVAESGLPFDTADARAEPRLAGHPSRETVIAYHAAPLVDASGRCFGSLCHWDVRPRLVPPSEVRLMFAVAPIVARVVEGAAAPSAWRDEMGSGHDVEVGADDELHDLA